MPSFKPKNMKKIIVSKKNITTLDGKHKEIIDNIALDKQEQLPLLLNEKKKLYLKQYKLECSDFGHIGQVQCQNPNQTKLSKYQTSSEFGHSL